MKFSQTKCNYLFQVLTDTPVPVKQKHSSKDHIIMHSIITKLYFHLTVFDICYLLHVIAVLIRKEIRPLICGLLLLFLHIKLLGTNSDRDKQIESLLQKNKNDILIVCTMLPLTNQIVDCLYSMYCQYRYHKCRALVFSRVLPLKVKMIQIKLLHFTFK